MSDNKIFLDLDANNYIIAISEEERVGFIESSVTSEEVLRIDITDGYHKYIDGRVVKVEDISPQYRSYLEKQLRRNRDILCFPIINRGNLWYNNLTEQQKLELSDWYTAWLNVTETLEVPTRPEWLK